MIAATVTNKTHDVLGRAVHHCELVRDHSLVPVITPKSREKPIGEPVRVYQHKERWVFG